MLSLGMVNMHDMNATVRWPALFVSLPQCRRLFQAAAVVRVAFPSPDPVISSHVSGFANASVTRVVTERDVSAVSHAFSQPHLRHIVAHLPPRRPPCRLRRRQRWQRHPGSKKSRTGNLPTTSTGGAPLLSPLRPLDLLPPPYP